MCVIYVGDGAALTAKDFASMRKYSSDGIGFLGVESDRYSRWTKASLAEQGRAEQVLHLINSANELVLVHFRLATSGTLGKENLHPFRLPGGGYLAHNGVIGSLGDKLRSDTRELVEDIWPIHGADWVNDPALRKAWQAIISGQRIALVNVPGIEDEVSLWGDWKAYPSEKASWVSNLHWQPYVAPKATAPKTGKAERKAQRKAGGTPSYLSPDSAEYWERKAEAAERELGKDSITAQTARDNAAIVRQFEQDASSWHGESCACNACWWKAQTDEALDCLWTAD